MSARIQVQGLSDAHMAYLDAHPSGRAAAIREALNLALALRAVSRNADTVGKTAEAMQSLLSVLGDRSR